MKKKIITSILTLAVALSGTGVTVSASEIQAPEQATEAAVEQTSETQAQVTEQTAEQATEQTSEQTTEQSTETEEPAAAVDTESQEADTEPDFAALDAEAAAVNADIADATFSEETDDSEALTGNFGGEILGYAYGVPVMKYDTRVAGGSIILNADGDIRYIFPDGTMAKNCYLYDGTDTFYLGYNGAPYKNTTCYSMDGHMMYFDSYARLVRNNFSGCEDVGFAAYFDDNGYALVDQTITVNGRLYYLNGYGQLEQHGWFWYANGQDLGFANWDGTLITDCFSYDLWGRMVHFKSDGTLTRGELLTDGTWFYDMDATDGHCKGSFKLPYNYFAIGNSITMHPIVPDLWWGSWGMAASSYSTDYVNRVSATISDHYQVNTKKIYYTTWERAADRNSTLSQLDPYLTSDLDLVTIQLGDNITGGYDTLVSDYQNLINYVRAKAPNAKIMVIDEFCWPNSAIQSAQRQVCEANGIAYIDLSAINHGGYTAGLGTTVFGDDGSTHAISNPAVAAHPGDAAMSYIADQILTLLCSGY